MCRPDTGLLRPHLELSMADGGNQNAFEPETRSLADPDIEARDPPQLSTESDLADRRGIRRSPKTSKQQSPQLPSRPPRQPPHAQQQ